MRQQQKDNRGQWHVNAEASKGKGAGRQSREGGGVVRKYKENTHRKRGNGFSRREEKQ